MIRKYRNCRQTFGIVRKSHTTITRHQDDRQSKATSFFSLSLFLSLSLSLSLFPIKMIAKLEYTTKHINIAESRNGSNNQQRIHNNRATALNGQQPKPLGQILFQVDTPWKSLCQSRST